MSRSKEEDRLLALVRAAIGLADLEDELGGPHHALRAQPRRSRRVWPWGIAATAVAASILIALWPPTEVRINQLLITPRPVRAGTLKYELSVKLSEPGFIRILVVDERGEPWTMPLDTSGTKYVARIERHGQFEFDPTPHPEDPRGPSRGRFVVIVATAGNAPSAEELLESIPDPVVSEPITDALIQKALEELTAALCARFHCDAQMAAIPEP